MARIVLNTFGSFGDLHPYLALAIELKKRGHQPLLATSGIYRAKVEQEGIAFAPVRPDLGELLDKPDIIEKIWHPTHGSEFLIRDYILPQLEASFEDLQPVCRDADLLITHAAAYAGPIVADLLKLRWLSIALQPALFMSSYDPPVLAPALWLRHFYPLGRWTFSIPFVFADRRVRSWAAPIFALRRRLGLSPPSDNPILRGVFSPWGTLALFSKEFASPQPDWPPKVQMTGFVFYDKLGPVPEGKEIPPSFNAELARFLENGPPPIVFTLGSSAVMQAGTFYRESLQAVLDLGVRAVLLISDVDARQLGPLPETVFAGMYAPYSELLPRAAINVHQGGVGTTAQALRAGRPMLVVPWSHDQPDNADRARRMGVARVLQRRAYTRRTAAKQLETLLNDGGYADRAASVAALIREENGTAAACNAIEDVLRTGNPVAAPRVES